MKAKILLKDRQEMTRAWARGEKVEWPQVEEQENETKKRREISKRPQASQTTSKTAGEKRSEEV